MLPPGPFVTTEWLAAHAADVRVVDVRGVVLPAGTPGPRYQPKRQDYDRAHLPGAVFVDWTRDIVDLDDPVPAQVAPAERFAAAMGGIGVGDDTLVVAYDDYRSIFAGRLAWALRYYGHDAVRVLDGGLLRWTKEGRPLTDHVPSPAPARFTPRPRQELRRSAAQVAAGGALLIDARPPAQFRGEVSAAQARGHIPGARNVPYPSLVDEDGRLLGKEALAAAFAAAGVDPASPRELVTYCNGGVSCTVVAMALEVLGRGGVAVYDGSWNEWGNDPSRPVEQ